VIEVRTVDVAGFQFVLKPPLGWRVVEEDPRYAPFLNSAAPPGHGTIEAELGFDPPDLSGLEPLFDTGGAWSGYRDGSDILIDMAPAGVPGRLWTARLTDQGQRLLIYCGTPLVFAEKGDRCIRNPVRYPLDQILMLALLPGAGGLVVHGAGAMRGGVGLAFPGCSGAGKSTTMRLMRGVAGVTGLSDDRVVLQKASAGIRVIGTPWSGDERVAENAQAPLKALVFLHHAGENKLVPIDRSRALRQLLPTACIPWFDNAGAEMGLAVCDSLVNGVPAYEMHFRPEAEALGALDSLW
jgi:hypothetical protein